MRRLLVLFMVLSLFACQKEEVICGGTTDQSDPDAPKVIESKEIKEFYTYFYIDAYQNSDGLNIFEYEIQIKDDHLLLKEVRLEEEKTLEKEVLHQIQDIIDQYELVQYNGIDKLTAGIAPAYYKCEMKVLYESGEVLHFRMQNDPEAAWAIDLYKLLNETE